MQDFPDQDFKRSTKNNKVAYENLIVNVYLTKRITRNVSSLTPGCSLSHAIPHSRAAEGHYDYETRPTYRLTGGRIWLSPSPPVHSKCHNKRLLEPPLRKVEEAASYPLQRPVAQITNHLWKSFRVPRSLDLNCCLLYLGRVVTSISNLLFQTSTVL